ncbi:hypothetical protein HYX11_00935 [Candidatus Woesearchaeota archaeon]|nr:hypothetical protein [Candidatus Woesearchaeota archaeon]
MKDKFTRLKGYFKGMDKQSNSFKITDVGLYLPSSLGLMNKALKIISEKKLITDKDIALDAGSGDGRIVGLLAGIFGIPTIGIEYDHELVQRSNNTIKYLKRIKIIEETKAEIIEGNFNLDKTYHKQGIEFAEFSFIFNYINNQKFLAEKIRLQSKKGTRLLLLDPNKKQPELFRGLNYVEPIILNEPPEEEINPLEKIMSTYYLHLYQK